VPTNKSRAEYMAARRAAIKAAQEKKDDPSPKRDLRVAKVEPEVIETHEVGDDRRNGLPRTNYYGDWVPTIQKMSSAAIQRILDSPSIKTSKRG
jgi:hypothetical protein